MVTQMNVSVDRDEPTRYNNYRITDTVHSTMTTMITPRPSHFILHPMCWLPMRHNVLMKWNMTSCIIIIMMIICSITNNYNRKYMARNDAHEKVRKEKRQDKISHSSIEVEDNIINTVIHYLRLSVHN